MMFSFVPHLKKVVAYLTLFFACTAPCFLSAAYKLTLAHDPTAVTLTCAKDGNAPKPLIVKIDPKTHTFIGTDFMHELLDIEPVHNNGQIALSLHEGNNEFSAMFGVDGIVHIVTMTMHDDMTIKSDANIVLDGAVNAYGSVTFIGEHGVQIDNNKTLFIRNLMVDGLLINHGIMYSSDDARLTASELVNNGTITGALKTDKEEKLGHHFIIKADTIINKGLMIGGQNFELQATKEILNYGIWTTNKQFSVKAPHIRNFKAMLKERNEDQGIHGDGSFTADCDTFTNALDARFAIKGDIALTVRTTCHNAGLWHSDGNQQLTVEELEIEKDHVLEMNGNGTITCKGTVVNKGLLAVNGNGLFNCSNYYNDGTTWTKGTMTFNVPGTFENRQTGRIESVGFLTIDATKFLNQAGFIFGHNGGRLNAKLFTNEMIITEKLPYYRYDKCEDSCVFCGCTNRWLEGHTYLGSNPPVIAVTNGPLELNLDQGNNREGIIASEKDLIFNIITSFNNDVHVKETLQSSLNGGWTENAQHAFDARGLRFYPSVLASSGSNIKFNVLNNPGCTIEKQGDACKLQQVRNTGQMLAHNDIEITKDGKGLADLYNGLSQASNAIVFSENFNSINIAILSQEDVRNKYIIVPTNDPKALYQFDTPFADAQHSAIDPCQQVYVDDGKPWGKIPRHVLSPTLQADGMQQALAIVLGRNILPAYETMFEQLMALVSQGLRVGFVHGKLQTIGDETSSDSAESQNKFSLDALHSEQYEGIITSVSGTISPQELAQKVTTWSDGKHIPTLTQEQIDILPYPFVYYSRVAGSDLVQPNLHLPKEYLQNLWNQPGTIQAGGVIQTIGFSLAENTGRMIGNKIIIKAGTVTNRRRTTSTTQTVHQSGGWLSRGEDLHYEVITPERYGGEMIAGVSIDIIADNDVVNQGGTIMSVDVLMKSKNGSIINKNNPVTRVIDWNTGFWGSAFGDQSSALVCDFQPGVVLVSGKLQMLSPTQKIINTASTIMAHDATLRGYLGIVSETLASVNTASTSRSHSWFAFQGTETQEFHQGPAIMGFDKVELISEQGLFKNIGAQFKAKQARFDTRENSFEPVTVTLRHSVTEGGVKAFQVFGSHSDIQQTIQIPSVVMIDEAVIKAALDNTLEAVFMIGTDGGKAQYVHFIAGRDTLFKGAHQTTTLDTKSFSIGVSFFGSEALKKAIDGHLKDSVIALAAEDPLLRSLAALKHAQDWQDKTGESAHVAVELLKVLVDHVGVAQTAGLSLKNTLGMRYGINDAQGTFTPLLRFRCEFSRTSTSVDQVVPSVLYVKDIIVDSGRNIEQLDGTKIIADNAEFVGDTMRMTSGKTVSSMIQSIYGSSAILFGKNLVAGGADYTHVSADGAVHDNARVEVAKKLVVKVRELIARGGLMLGSVVDMHTHNMCFESVQNLSDQNMLAGAVNVGFGPDLKINVQAGMTAGSHDSAQTAERSGVFARNKLSIDATGAIKLIGANLEQIEPGEHGSLIKTSLLDTRDLTDYDASDTQSFGIDTSAIKAASGIPLDVNVHDSKKIQKQHSLISKTIDLHADTMIGGKLVRNAEEQTEVIEDGHSHWRIVAPVVDTKKLQDAVADKK